MTRTTESIRWRGGQVTRIEALTDAVFGFAITLLVVSLDVPNDFASLLGVMKGFIAFGFTFALLILIWSYHYRLFSRFDLEDTYTIVLNSILLFVVLFYIYPLKFVANTLINGTMRSAFTSVDQVAQMMTIYALGFIAVFGVFALLYHHAYRIRERLQLSALETLYARQHVNDCLIMVGSGVVSIALAQLLPTDFSAMVAGFSDFLIGPAQYFNGAYFAKLKRQVEIDEPGLAQLPA